MAVMMRHVRPTVDAVLASGAQHRKDRHMARIAVGGFQHETNCFVPVKTDYSYFASVGDRPPLCRGDDVLRNLPNKQFAMSGFLAAMADKHELVPLLWTSGGAGGYVTREAFERIAAEMIG